MKKSLKLAIIGVLALTAGVSLSHNSYAAGIVEDTKDAYNNIGVNVKKASIGSSDKVDVSRTYVQYGSEGTRSFIRFATAISGPVKNIKYVRTVAGLGTKEKEVTTVYKGIQAAGAVYYYNGTDVVTTPSELTDNYYWACYTIEFTSDTYKAADITAYIVVESEEEGAEVIESTPRTESYEDLKNEAENTLYIGTVEELKAFRDDVNSGNTYEGKFIELTNNIDLNNEDFTPIGLGEYFMGTFDGNGNTISNLKIDAVGDEIDWSVGLFGIANKATIRNLNVKNADVHGDQQVAAVCGWAIDSTFENVHVSGDINVVADYAYAAGIVADGDASLDNCSVIANEKGTIKSISRNNSAGLVADFKTGNTITNSTVKNLDIYGWTAVGSIVGQLYYGNAIEGCSVENVTLNKTRDGGFPSIGLVNGTWVKGSEVTTLKNLSFKNVVLNDASKSSILDQYPNCDTTTLYGAPYNSAYECDFNANIENISYDAITDNVIRSVESSTLYIRTIEQLKAFRDDVNAGNTYKGKTVVLANDIDLNNENWTPIGTNGDVAGFQGTFDGNYKTIYNLRVEQNTPAYQSAGLFGSARDGEIKNFTIENAYISSTTTGSATSCGTAVVVGSAQFTLTINNVDVKNAEVYSNRYAAVISGYFNGTITDCDVVNAKVVATPDNYSGSYDNGDKVGGIVGYINGSSATISNNTIDNFQIKAYRDLGGIVGAGHANNLSNNKATNGYVISDQTTNNYGNKTPNNNPILGRNLGSSTLDASNTSKNVLKEATFINNIEELKAFRDEVNAGNSFAGKAVLLTADIDLANENWTPIGTSSASFNGTFDGNGHKVSNLYVNVAGGSNLGLFGYTQNGEVKNLVVENASVSGRLNVAVVAGTPYTTKYTNITIQGHIEVNGLAYVGGLGGKNCYADVTDVTINADETSYIKADSRENGNAYRTYVGGVIGFMGEGSHTLKNVKSNIDVIGSTCDVGGVVGIAHYGNNFINCASSGDVTLTNSEDGIQYEIGGIAGVWHNETGYAVTFTNCSYTGTLSSTYYVEDNALTVENFKNNNLVGSSYNTKGTGRLIIDGVEYTA